MVQIPANPLVIVLDPGSSLLKIIHTGRAGNAEAISIKPEVAPVTEAQIQAQEAEIDDPVLSASVTVDGRSYAVGSFATDVGGKQHHELSKWQDLGIRVLAVLGLVHYALKLRSNEFTATIGLLLPRDEVNPPDREEQLNTIKEMAQNFVFRGTRLSCTIDFKVATEGAGLFSGHAAYLFSQSIRPTELDVPVLMCGERNTSLLVFRGGKLNPALSASDGTGFYRFLQQIKSASCAGNVPTAELVQAIIHKQDKLRIVGGQIVTLQPHIDNALENYYQATLNILKAKLPGGNISVSCGGGTLIFIWDKIEAWFKSMDIEAYYPSPTLGEELHRWKFKESLQPIRFADALGVYRSIAASRPNASTSNSASPVGAAK